MLGFQHAPLTSCSPVSNIQSTAEALLLYPNAYISMSSKPVMTLKAFSVASNFWLFSLAKSPRLQMTTLSLTFPLLMDSHCQPSTHSGPFYFHFLHVIQSLDLPTLLTHSNLTPCDLEIWIWKVIKCLNFGRYKLLKNCLNEHKYIVLDVH